MTDKSWKKWERWVCRQFGGQRRGPDYRDAQGGKNDCSVPGWSIECKYGARMTYQVMLDACRQAEKAAERFDIPVAVVKRKGDANKDGLVVMRAETFLEWFAARQHDEPEKGANDVE